MKTQSYFTVGAIVCFLFAISLIFIPQQVSDIYNADNVVLPDSMILFSRGYGYTLFAMGAAYWAARHALPSEGRRALLLLGTISTLLASLHHLYAVLTGVQKLAALGTVVMMAVLAVWGGMLFLKSEKAAV